MAFGFGPFAKLQEVLSQETERDDRVPPIDRRLFKLAADFFSVIFLLFFEGCKKIRASRMKRRMENKNMKEFPLGLINTENTWLKNEGMKREIQK
jgi:hypothetical protein